MQFMVSSKHLAGLPLDEAARHLRAMNISALDLTVRAGGHVEPARVAEELPQIADELKSRGISIGQITTDITDANAPQTRAILESAARLGIGFYKLGYYKYEGFGTLRKARVHPGLYQRRGGRVDSSTIAGAGFGYRLDEIERELPTPIADCQNS